VKDIANADSPCVQIHLLSVRARSVYWFDDNRIFVCFASVVGRLNRLPLTCLLLISMKESRVVLVDEIKRRFDCEK